MEEEIINEISGLPIGITEEELETQEELTNEEGGYDTY